MSDTEDAKRFADLNPEARKFIAGLSDADVDLLRTMMSTARAFSGWCRVSRWLFLAAFAVLLMASQSWDAFKNLFGWKTH